ncbi:unnamed protein product [Oreochromis niloticus]|nr:unnamed protein product [Mustela putorius furo]
MKRGAQVGLAGLCNTGLELEDMTGRTVQGSRSSVSAAAWWVSYYRGRWRQERRKLTGFQVEVKYCGLAEDDEDDKEQRDKTDNINKNQQLNKKLLDHFRHLAASNQDTDQVDLQLLDRAISDGADPNASDRYGQTVLHEISRAWRVDVMRFFLDRGSDLLRPDQFGVTVLHVASALDYQGMIQFLLDRKADPEARTFLDQQTPLHYAAKNDAIGSIRLLLQAGASIGCTNYKHRTPLQLAANAAADGDSGGETGSHHESHLPQTDPGQMESLRQDWWRVLFVVLALLLTLEEVLREVWDTLRSRKKLHLWQQLVNDRGFL